MDYSKIEEAAELKKWEERGYLTGITDPHVRIVTSLMLENQELFDKNYGNPLPNALELVKQVIPNLLAHKIVSVQPILGPAGFVFYERFTHDIQDKTLSLKIHEEDIAAKTKKFKTQSNDLTEGKDRPVEEIAADIILEQNLEILNDLWNNVGTISHIEGNDVTFDQLYNATHNMNNTIYRKTFLNYKKWIVVGEKTFDKFARYFKSISNPPYVLHVVNGWDKDGFLMGMKGDKFYESAYVYSPYIMFCKTPVISDPEFCPRPGILTRYGKKLWRAGSKHYGKITLNPNATFKDFTNAINTTCSSGFIPPCG